LINIKTLSFILKEVSQCSNCTSGRIEQRMYTCLFNMAWSILFTLCFVYCFQCLFSLIYIAYFNNNRVLCTLLFHT